MCGDPAMGPALCLNHRLKYYLLQILGQAVPDIQIHADRDTVSIERMANYILGYLLPAKIGEAIKNRPGKPVNGAPFQCNVYLPGGQGDRFRPNSLDDEPRQRRDPDLLPGQVGNAPNFILGVHEVITLI